MKTLISIAAATLLASVAAGPALAQDRYGNDWISVSALVAKLEAQGFTVRQIERDDGRYEVDLIDTDGVRYEAKVDRVTGEILSRYRDDD